jgi:coenzyme PQQ precursor peptide PqqA
MAWTTPTIVEICIGLEINGYLPAEFWACPPVAAAAGACYLAGRHDTAPRSRCSTNRAANYVAVLKKCLAKGEQWSLKRIYVFRCNESALYAFTVDREGRTLPLQMYPQITWRFEQTLTFRLDGDSQRKKTLRVALAGIATHGFHLIHAAIYGELLGFSSQPTVGWFRPKLINVGRRHVPLKSQAKNVVCRHGSISNQIAPDLQQLNPT